MHRSIGMSPISLVLSRHPNRVTTFNFSWAILSDLSGTSSLHLFREHLLAKLTLIRKNVDSQLPVAQKKYNYVYYKCVRNVGLQNEREVFVDRPLLAVNTIKYNTTDKPTYKKLMLKSNGPFPIKACNSIC